MTGSRRLNFLFFLVIQIFAYFAEWLVYFSLRSFMGIVLANIIAKSAAVVFAFHGHRILTFKASAGNASIQLVKYLATFCLNAGIATTLLYKFQQHLPEVIAKGLSDAILVIFSFWIARKFIFVSATPADGKQ
jgi:putative flippase GtrA